MWLKIERSQENMDEMVYDNSNISHRDHLQPGEELITYAYLTILGISTLIVLALIFF